jgi:hypothetical protein
MGTLQVLMVRVSSVSTFIITMAVAVKQVAMGGLSATAANKWQSARRG